MISSLYVSKVINIKHQNVIQHIITYENEFEKLGKLKKIKNKSTVKGGRPSIYYELSEKQVLLLLSLTKNNENTIDILVNYYSTNELILKLPKEKKGYVYIIQKKDKTFKIGCSMLPSKRIRAIETQQGENLYFKYISDITIDYYEIEALLHQQYKKWRLEGEWFKFDSDEKILKVVNSLKQLVEYKNNPKKLNLNSLFKSKEEWENIRS